MDVLLSIIYEKSNLKSALKSKKCSITIFDFKKIFIKIQQYKKDSKLYQYFFKEIDIQLKNTNLKTYAFIFPLNVEFTDFDSTFNDLISLFEIKRLNSEDYFNIKDEEVPEGWINLTLPFKVTLNWLLNQPVEIVEIKVKAGDLNFAINDSKFKIESFLGLLSFVTNLKYRFMEHRRNTKNS